VLILVFARGLKVLPSAGSGTWAHLVLPTITLALPFLAILVRLTRSGLLEVVHEGYVQTARAKGLGESVVILVHALRNALIPIVTVVGLQFGALLGGTVIVETVFAWPGVGRLLIDSIGRRDYGVVQASILLVATIFVGINLVVDLLYGFLDPRVRLAGD
jgi:peptide/nickel transport system permease protein